MSSEALKITQLINLSLLTGAPHESPNTTMSAARAHDTSMQNRTRVFILGEGRRAENRGCCSHRDPTAPSCADGHRDGKRTRRPGDVPIRTMGTASTKKSKGAPTSQEMAVQEVAELNKMLGTFGKLGISKEAIKQRLRVYLAITDGYGCDKGAALSLSDRKKMGNKRRHQSYTFGEASFVGIALVLLRCAKVHGLRASGGRSTFLDIGSGLGKPCFTAMLVGNDFGRVVGLEILNSLVAAANDMLAQRWSGGKQLSATAPGMTDAIRQREVKFLCRDAFALNGGDGGGFPGVDLQHLTLVFVNTTVFTQGDMRKVAQSCKDCLAGTLLVTTTRSLLDGVRTRRDPSGKLTRETSGKGKRLADRVASEWEQLETVNIKSSWGRVDAYIQRRTAS